MLKFKLLALFSLFLMPFAVQGQEAETQENQTFRENYKSDYKGAEFTYTEEQKVEEKPVEIEVNEPSEGTIRLIEVLIFVVKLIGYAAIGFVVFLVVRAVLLQGNLNLFKKEKVNQGSVSEVKSEEQIENLDWIQLALKAKSENQLKLAVRYYFLAFLKNLSKQNQIVYHPEKSNREYYYEIQERGSKDAFQTLSRVYDYCWYGDFDINEEQFQKAENIFKSYLS